MEDTLTISVENQDLLFRPIQSQDNAQIAAVIRAAFVEFDAPRKGSVFEDPETDALSELFKTEGSGYWVIEQQGNILGGCGFFPTPGLPEGMGEIVKFYTLPQIRGKGIASALFSFVEQHAAKAGYNRLYLESIPEFGNAVRLYSRHGYRHLSAPICFTGHTAMTIFMEKSLL